MAVKNIPISKIEKEFHGLSHAAIVRKFCGELLGNGFFRQVYVLRQNPNYVVKVVQPGEMLSFPNVTEWMNYKDYQYTALQQFLAPCVMINDTGTVMIQQRANWAGKKKKDYPKRLPSELSDFKYENYGWIGEQFVCFDYSFLRGYKSRTKTRSIQWRARHYKVNTPLNELIKIW
jgi:hypothetical protein